MDNNNAQPQANEQNEVLPAKKSTQSLIDRIYGERANLLQKILTYVSIFLIILTPIVFLHHIITGISMINKFGTYNYNLNIIQYCAAGFAKAINYLIFGLILAALERLISK